MDESVKRLRANKVIAGCDCGWCGELVNLGDEIAVCRECELVQHAACWDRKGGCGSESCVNAPLERMESSTPGEDSAPPEGKVACSNCGRFNSPNVTLCPYCRTSLGGGAPRMAPTHYPVQVSKAEKPLTAPDWLISFLCPMIGCIVGIVALIQGETKRGGTMIVISIGAAMLQAVIRQAVRESTR